MQPNMFRPTRYILYIHKFVCKAVEVLKTLFIFYELHIVVINQNVTVLKRFVVVDFFWKNRSIKQYD